MSGNIFASPVISTTSSVPYMGCKMSTRAPVPATTSKTIGVKTLLPRSTNKSGPQIPFAGITGTYTTLEERRALEAQKQGAITYALLKNELCFPVEYAGQRDWSGYVYRGLPLPEVIETDRVACFVHVMDEGNNIDQTYGDGQISAGGVAYKGLCPETGISYLFVFAWSNGRQKLAHTEILNIANEEQIDWDRIYQTLTWEIRDKTSTVLGKTSESICSMINWDGGPSRFQRSCITMHFKQDLVESKQSGNGPKNQEDGVPDGSEKEQEYFPNNHTKDSQYGKDDDGPKNEEDGVLDGPKKEDVTIVRSQQKDAGRFPYFGGWLKGLFKPVDKLFELLFPERYLPRG